MPRIPQGDLPAGPAYSNTVKLTCIQVKTNGVYLNRRLTQELNYSFSLLIPEGLPYRVVDSIVIVTRAGYDAINYLN